MVKEKSSGYFV